MTSSNRTAQVVLSVLMNAVLALAIVLVVRVVIEFFGAVAVADASRAFVRITDPLSLPLGISAPRTPYGGVFDSDAAVTVAVLLALEWALSVARFRA